MELFWPAHVNRCYNRINRSEPANLAGFAIEQHAISVPVAIAIDGFRSADAKSKIPVFVVEELPAVLLSDAAEDADSIAALTIAAVLNVLLNQGEGWLTHPVEDVVKKARIRLRRVLGS